MSVALDEMVENGPAQVKHIQHNDHIAECGCESSWRKKLVNSPKEKGRTNHERFQEIEELWSGKNWHCFGAFITYVSEVIGKADTFRHGTAVRGDGALFVPAAPPVFAAAAAACVVQPGAARFASER